MKIKDLIAITRSVIESTFDLDANEWHYEEEKDIEINGDVFNVCYDVKQTLTESISEETTSEFEIDIHYIELPVEYGEPKLIYHSQDNLFGQLGELFKPFGEHC